MRYCELDEIKYCEDCGQCQVCDLDKSKLCDNCCECIGLESEYNVVEIEQVEDGADYAFGEEEEKIFVQWMEKKQRDSHS